MKHACDLLKHYRKLKIDHFWTRVRMFNSNIEKPIETPCKMACYQAIDSIDKRRILEIHSNGGDFLTLAQILGIKKTTAYTIVRRGREENLPAFGVLITEKN